MQTLEKCPACGCEELRDVDLGVDLTAEDKELIGPTVIWQADYASCPRCELMFARNRQERDEIDAYYDAFPLVEKREYTVYPLPQRFIDAQNAFCDRLVGNVERAGLIRPDMSVLNIRCECGVHLARLRDHYGVKELYGLDHFETNLRHAREDLGLEHVEYLHPYLTELPFGTKTFDLILANHMLTHALDPMGLLAIFRARVKPGGAIVFYNELDHIPIMDLRKTFKRGVVSYHKQLLTRTSLENLVRRGGYRTEWLDYDAQGIKWASGRHSRAIIGWPDRAIDIGEITAPQEHDLHEAYLKGRAKHRPTGILQRAKRLIALA